MSSASSPTSNSISCHVPFPGRPWWPTRWRVPCPSPLTGNATVVRPAKSRIGSPRWKPHGSGSGWNQVWTTVHLRQTDGRCTRPLPLQDLKPDGFTREQRLLLQVDSDESLGWCWGDQGRLYFTLHETDLASGDFTKVSVISDSH
ncbi:MULTISPECIES: DUF1963 domain-containing protein [unclassified Nonomuraea]|uniref:DUF1963 domain-containing protein n=1 Tax=unclassified Nonomuraea TaxID=2593643 RepID=UPI00339A8FD6